MVGVDVPSATSLDASGCAANVADRTHFGTVLPGASAVTGVDCTVTFGSSNDVGRLRVAQSDGSGIGMFQYTRGALDPGFSGDGMAFTSIGPGARNDDFEGLVVQPDVGS